MLPVPGRRTLLLELDLTQPLVDSEPGDPLAWLRERRQHHFLPTLRALYEAGSDPHVAGLVAKIGPGLPWATMQELRLGVQAFRTSGKPAVAWAETFGEGAGETAAYVLASAFDQIWLQPGGSLGLLGVGIETTFLRGALDKLGVLPEFEQRGEYKNAPDQLLRTEYSQAHREALDRLAESIASQAVEQVAAGRKLAEAQVRDLLDAGPHVATEAKALGLVDRLGFRDQVLAAVRAQVGEEGELLFADRWAPRRRLRMPRRGRVGLVTVRGTIVSGRSRAGLLGRQVGSDLVAAQLRAALDDDHIKAVVLRVDSPGGSAVASEVIWREVCRVREAGKPVVVSMGNVAASGGYFIACPADVILALPATLTGSIGVYGGKLVVRDLLERAGVTTGSVQRGERALMFSGRRRFTDAERARFAATIDAVYDDFVGKVAAGRGLAVAAAEELARGRVWTGHDALAVGLVDQFGGLREAVGVARVRAGLGEDAPLVPALHLSPLARLGRPRSSDDPRAWAMTSWPVLSGAAGLTELAAALGLPVDAALRMPDLRIR